VHRIQFEEKRKKKKTKTNSLSFQRKYLELSRRNTLRRYPVVTLRGVINAKTLKYQVWSDDVISALNPQAKTPARSQAAAARCRAAGREQQE